ncbi:MAG: DNA polymerase III subunit delta, partial [Eudoraea sp.]
MEEVKQIVSDIRNKIFRPIYFLMGDESYYIDKISEYVAQNVLTEEEKAFNQMVLYGKEITIE